MSAGALERLERLLALLPYLQARPGVTYAEASAAFGVSEAQLRKDLDLLWVCGLPGHSPADLIDFSFEGDTIRVVEAAGVERPLRLTVDEALSLVVALRALGSTPGLVDRDAVDRALAKVEAVAGSAAVPADRVEVALEGEQQQVPVVREALEAGRALHLRYLVAARDEVTERDVDPMRLLVVDGTTYLEAWCRRAEGVRLFRLDRVEEARVLDEPAAPPATAEQRDPSQALYRPQPDHPVVRLVLDPAAHWVADSHPCESVEEVGDGRLAVVLRVASTDWVRRLVLGLGGAARVVEPAELAEQVRADARAALSAYAQ